MNNAAKLRERFGGTKATAVAAAAVDQINRGKRGKKLPSWWKAAP